MSALSPVVQLQIPVKVLPVLEPRRFKVLHGGRGGAKSHSVAQILLMLSMQRKLRILCVREVQKSLKQSSMQVLKDYIASLGLDAFFDTLQSTIRCRLTGSVFEFSGLREHTVNSIKSFEGADITWVEEGHSVSAHSWNVLIPTVIRKKGAEIWITFNPDAETDYVYDRFVKHTDPDALVIEINWRDNPWFGAEMDAERRKLKAVNDDLYDHVWEGKCRSIAGLLFKRRWFNRYKLGEHPDRLNRYVASDYAGGPDPDDPDSEPDFTEHGCWGLAHNGDLWAIDWWSGQDDPQVWIKQWLAMCKRNRALAAFEEKGAIRRSVDGAINKAMREAKHQVYRIGLASAGEKAARALGFAARAAAGQVWIPDCEWGDRLVNQLCAFNGQDGRIDDGVDVCSLIARGLDHMVDAGLPPPEPEPSPAPFTGDWLEDDNDDEHDAAARRRFYGS